MTQATTKMMKMMKSRKKSVLWITVILVLKLPRVHRIAPIARLMIKGLKQPEANSAEAMSPDHVCTNTIFYIVYTQIPF